MARKNLLEAFQKVAQTHDEAQRREAAPGSPSARAVTGRVTGGVTGAVTPEASHKAAPASAGPDPKGTDPKGKAAAAERADAHKPGMFALRIPKAPPVDAKVETARHSAVAGRGETASRADGLARIIDLLRPAPVLAAIVLVFSVGFALGRMGGGAGVSVAEAADAKSPNARAQDTVVRQSAAAAPPAAGSVAPAPSGVPPRADRPPAEPSSPGAQFERSLRDPANRFTVLVVTYNDSAANRELGRELSGHLRTQGLKVSDPLPSGSSRLVVLAGAAPTSDALKATLNLVRSVRDPRDRAGAFSDALVLPISSFVNR